MPDFVRITDTSINNVSFSRDDIRKLLHNLKSSKIHGCDDISAKMIKLCGESLVEPLHIIFKNCIEKNWKLANVTPIHKKR